ncbi:MAG: TolC family protein [Nitrospirae bacterium]|nr:TolC family protein [Nitrospirota bacterium]
MPADGKQLTALIVAAFLFLFSGTGVYAETEELAGKTLTLLECISLGLKQNPLTTIAAQSLKAAQEKIGEANGGYYPTFRLSSTYTFTSQQEKTPLGADVFDTRLFLRQTLFDAGATSNLVKTIRHAATAREFEVRQTAADIILNTRTSFYDVLKKMDLVAVTKASFKTAERHLEQSRELYKEGLAPRSDVIKSEVRVSGAGLEVIRAENALLSAKATLATVMGLPATADFDLSDKKERDQLPALPSLKDVVASAYDQRPELHGARARISSAEAGVQQAKSGLYPNISLDASYGWQKESYFPDERKWSVGLTVGLPVFEQITTRSKIGQAMANLAGAEAVGLQTRRNIELEVQLAWLSMKEAMERRSVTEKALEQAEEDMRVSEGRYKEGVGNILEVIDAQTALTQARTENVITLYDIANAGARLDKAAGKDIPEEINK